VISRQVEELFEASSQLPQGERAAFLDAACGTDTDVRIAVEELLTAANSAEHYFSDLSDRLGLQSVFDGELELPRTESIGAYRLLKLIGRGGMGVVYLAERADDQFEKQVALKLLPIGIGGEAAQRRFLAERQILAHLVHPHIARLLDGGISDDGTPYFVMDFVDGVPIDVYCNNNRLDVEQRLALFIDVAGAVEYAHRNLVVHRDIKPGNILVEASGDAKLLDFGVAKLLVPDTDEESLTRVAGRPLTLKYASPESIRGKAVTTAADIYSLGMLLYVLLTGRFPYSADMQDTAETQRLICEQDPIPPSRGLLSLPDDVARRIAANAGSTPRELAHRLQGDLDTIITKALRKDPDRRYSTVEQFIADLRRYQQGLPVAARPASAAYRVQKFARRHKAGVAAAVAIAIALLTVAATAIYSAISSARQAQQIAVERDKTEQINDFLLSIFELSSPNQTKGETVTALELLDRAAERVRTEMAGQSERQALLMHSIAVVYSEMTQFDIAKGLLEEARTLHRDSGTDRSAEYASSTELYAEVREIEGAFDEAEEIVQEAVGIRRELADPKDLAFSLLMLGRIQHKQGRTGEAESIYREALQIRRSVDDDDDETIANALSYIGSILQQRGELADAEAMQREALTIRRDLYGEDHMILIESHHNLGVVLMDKGELEAARSNFGEALRISIKLVPEGEQGQVFLFNGLGAVYDRMGSLEQARENFQRSLDMLMQFFGAQHPNTFIVQGNLGRVLVKQGNFGAGEALLRSGVAGLSEAVPTHHHLPRMQLFLGRSLAETARFAEAEELIRTAHARLNDIRGSDHEHTREAVRFLIELYDDWGRPAEADAYREELLDDR